jgi:two-component system, NarL family, sensor histidine kinase UhpB
MLHAQSTSYENDLVQMQQDLEKNKYEILGTKAKKLLDYALQNKDRHFQGQVLNILSESYYKQGLKKDADIQNSLLLNITESLNDTALHIKALNRKAALLLDDGKNSEAEIIIKKALPLSTRYTALLADVYSNYGTYYLAKGDKEKAIQNFTSALELHEKTNNLFGQGEAYSNISSLYYLSGKISDAISYQEKSIAIREKADDKNGLTTSYMNIGQLHWLKGNKSLASSYMQKSISAAELIKNPKKTAAAYGGLSAILAGNSEYAEALKWQEKAILIFEDMQDHQMLSRLYVNTGALVSILKDSASSVKYFNKSIDLSKKLGNKENIANAYEKLYLFYASKSNFKEAYKNHAYYIIYRDSITAKSNLAKIEEVKTKYETEKKDNEIKRLQIEEKLKTAQLEKQNAELLGNKILAEKKEAEIKLLSNEALLLKQATEIQEIKLQEQLQILEKEKLSALNANQQLKINEADRKLKEQIIEEEQRNNKILLVGLLLSLLAAGLFINRLQLKKKIEQQNILLSMRQELSKDLHDEIGSTLTSINILSNISNKIMELQPTQAKDMMGQIATQSKTVQQNMSDIVWSMRAENENVLDLMTRIREYVSQTLEPLQIESSIDVDQKLQNQALPLKHRKQILMICKEAINNIAKHSGATKMNITFTQVQNKFILQITDNGIWKGGTSGTGSKTMRERAESMAGTFAIDHQAGTNIKITLPMNSQFM